MPLSDPAEAVHVSDVVAALELDPEEGGGVTVVFSMSARALASDDDL